MILYIIGNIAALALLVGIVYLAWKEPRGEELRP
jgi:hypothetical protein